MKDIVKLDPLASIVVAGHSTPSGVYMATFTVRVTGAQGFLHDMLLPVMNVPRLGCHPFLGGMAALQGANTIIAKEPYLDVGQFKIPLRKDTDYPTINYNLELATKGNHQTEVAIPTRVISEHTIPTGSALASQTLRSGAMGAFTRFLPVTRPFIVISTAA